MLERSISPQLDEGMNLELSFEQQMLGDMLDKLFAEYGSNARLRAQEPLGFDPDLWSEIWALEIPQLRVSEDDGSLMHAIVVAEAAGRHLASVPLAEALVVRRMMAELDLPDDHWLAKARDGRDVISFALHDLDAQPGQLLTSGAIGTAVLGLVGDTVCLMRDLGRGVAPEIHGAIPGCRLSRIEAAKRETLEDPRAAALFRAAREELRLLTAAQVAAAALRAIDIAAEYACEREAFGKKIGEFQGLSHPLADAYTECDGARLLCWRAADAVARRETDADALISMASWWAGHAARPAAILAMRTLGGYGMTREYVSELYTRRINAWSLANGTPDASLDEIAARLWQGAKTDLPAAGDNVTTFHWGAAGDRIAERMRRFIEQRHNAGMRQFMRQSIDGFDRDLHLDMAKEGLLYPDAPKEFGGPGLSGIEAFASRHVFGDYYWNILAPSVTDMIAKTILHFGREQIKREVLPGLYSGEKHCTLGYSEPSGGSDIFACKTTATRDGDDWLINGQKQFTSTAHLADYAIMVTRTAPDKYRGITIFIVPLDQPGFSFSEIKTIGEERTNSTFFDNVRVPDAYRIGEVNGGIKVLAAALAIEQSAGDLYTLSLTSLIREVLQGIGGDDSAKALEARPGLRRALAGTAAQLVVQDVLNRRALWANETGRGQKHFGPMAKLFGSEALTRTAMSLMEAGAPETLEIGIGDLSMPEFLYRRSIPATIYAGTSEIQRSLIAEAGLGLPRSR